MATKKEEVKEKTKVKYFSIKILKNVILPIDLKKYVEKNKGETRKYLQGEIIEDVHIKYLERFAKFPEHIQVLEGEQ